MAGYLEDRWYKAKLDPETKKPVLDSDTGKPVKTETDRHGQGKRWRVKGVPGVRDRSFEKKTDADRWLKNAETDSGRGTFIDPRDGDITLREYTETKWWPKTRYPPSSKEAVEDRVFGNILPYLGGLSLRHIGTDEVAGWVVDAERDGLAPGTVRTCWRHLSSILQSAKEAKRIPDNPCRGYSTARPPAKPKQKARRLTKVQGLAVRAALGERYEVLFDLGAGCGLRQGEAFGVSPADLDGDNLHVARQVMRIDSRLCFGPPKGGKERDVPVPDAVAESIKRSMERCPPVEVTLPWVDPDLPSLAWESRPLRTVLLLTTTYKGNAVNRSDWNVLSWKPALGAAGVIDRLPPPEGMSEAEWRKRTRGSGKNGMSRWPEARDWGFHACRHTFASTVLQAGESVVTLAQWLGHADPAFTLRTYTHFVPEAGGSGTAAMDAWLR